MLLIFNLFFKIIKIFIYLLIFLSIIYLVYNAFSLWSSAKENSQNKTEAIVVLGAAQFDGKPSPVFENRLNHAQELYKLEIAPLIITVGGKQQGDRFTEAQTGKIYLEKTFNTTNVNAITDGKDTLESFELIREQYPDLKNITLVSDPAHLWRSRLMAQDLDFKASLSGTSSGPGSQLTNEYFVREYVASLRYRFIHYFPSQWSLLKSIVL